MSHSNATNPVNATTLPRSEDGDPAVFILAAIFVFGILILACMTLRRLRNERMKISAEDLTSMTSSAQNRSSIAISRDDEEDFGEV